MTQPARDGRREQSKPPQTPVHLTKDNEPGGKKESLGIPTPPADAPPSRAQAPVLPPKTIVQLLRSHGSVNAQEIAGYTPEEAAELIQKRVAVYVSGPQPPDAPIVRQDPEQMAQHAVQLERLRDCVRTALLNPRTVEANGRPQHAAVQAMMGVPVNPDDIDLVMGQLRR
jgi:hypothetical protein